MSLGLGTVGPQVLEVQEFLNLLPTGLPLHLGIQFS